VTVRAVIFDWGGTLTPWHTVDHESLWHDVCARHYSEARAAEVARALYAAERDVWAGIERSQESATLTHVFERARLSVPDAVLASYFEAWEPRTITDPDAPVLLRELRRRNISRGGHRRLLPLRRRCQRLQVKLARHRDHADGELAVHLGDQCLENLLRRDAQRLRGLRAVRPVPGVMRVGKDRMGDAQLAKQRGRRSASSRHAGTL
jgi:FMN phosphatase YigB (HAD superfamily)